MPHLAPWGRFPAALQHHLLQRMRERSVSLDDLYSLQLWVESGPEVPSGDWFKDFGSFKLCGRGEYPRTFLVSGQAAKGQEL